MLIIKNILGLPANQESALPRALDDGGALGSAGASITLRTGDANAGVQGVVSREEADAFLLDFLSRYAGASEIVVVSTFAQLPASIQEEAKRQNSDERSTKGVFHRGKVYLVVDSHASMADFEATMFHEVAGHADVPVVVLAVAGAVEPVR